MKSKITAFAIFMVLILGWQYLGAWGFFAHKRINRIAVFTLPKPLFNFYKSHIDYVTDHAVDADKRRYATKDEAPRHYIDIDHYGEDPFTNMPRNWDSAVAKFSEDTLLAYGIVPWHINKVYYRLVSAFKEKNIDQILRYSSDLGHYIGDAHVPLHTTENYNGQLSGQKGIHGFWESRLPELFADDYDYLLPKAKFIEKPLATAWDMVEASHAALDSVLLFEKKLSESFSEDKKYAYEERGQAMVRTYSLEFSTAYHNKLNGMVERRMRAAMAMVANYWFTAWVEAGQPDLVPLQNAELTPEALKAIENENSLWKIGKWKGRPETEVPDSTQQ
ncbi:MAG: zinc dependent phospholipase C family protein [Bacteroidetes bacterium]|nr:zinc dependent phospholipase C family protein [Bacteroidota bacterium]